VVSRAASEREPLDPIEPQMVWIDNSQLVIDYPAPSDETSFDCVSKKVGDILITCRTHTIR
jgi:hypothetical protein